MFTLKVYDAARRVLNSSLQPTINKLLAAKESATQQANVIKKISVDKANELLSTHYGAMAIQGVDNTSTLVNNLLNHYFPPTAEEESKPGIINVLFTSFNFIY